MSLSRVKETRRPEPSGSSLEAYPALQRRAPMIRASSVAARWVVQRFGRGLMILYLAQWASRSGRVVQTSRRKCGAGRFPEMCRKVFRAAAPWLSSAAVPFLNISQACRTVIARCCVLDPASLRLHPSLKRACLFGDVLLGSRPFSGSPLANESVRLWPVRVSPDQTTTSLGVAFFARGCSAIRHAVRARAARSFIVRAAVVPDPASTFTRESALLEVPVFGSPEATRPGYAVRP